MTSNQIARRCAIIGFAVGVMTWPIPFLIGYFLGSK